MKEHGVIFNDEMVRAILDGRKTQTRRIMNVQPQSPAFGLRRITEARRVADSGKYFWSESNAAGTHPRSKMFTSPFGETGDRIWVREAYSLLGNEDRCATDWNDKVVSNIEQDAARIYRASCEQKPGSYGLWSVPDDAFWKPQTDDLEFDGAWTPSIHMPRWASRILLEVTAIRVERLQSISEEDAAAEGVEQLRGGLWRHYKPGWTQHQLSARGSFASLWEAIYGEQSWQLNPSVWVVEFKRVEAGE